MKDAVVPCISCESAKLMEFDTKIVIHFRGLKDLNKPAIFTFPKLVVCLKCGSMRGNISAPELRLLRESATSVEEIAL